MNGYQVTFFTQQNRLHHGKPISEWLIHLAKELGFRGATVIPASEGIDHHHNIHSARFFDMADQPLSVVMVLTPEETESLFRRLRAEEGIFGIQLFYVKVAVEFGSIGNET